MVEGRCSSFLVDDNGLAAIYEAVVTLAYFTDTIIPCSSQLDNRQQIN